MAGPRPDASARPTDEQGDVTAEGSPAGEPAANGSSARAQGAPSAGAEVAPLGAVPAPEAVGPGVPASLWALAKTTLGVVGAPVAVPAMTAAALRTAQIARGRIEQLPEHLHALAEGRTPPLPGDRTVRLPAEGRYLITSDLHRCIAGRLDWPRRQRVKDLYAQVLTGYGEDGWDLIENGDVEDFWMVGGSTWGVLYDVAGLAELAAGRLLPGPVRPVHSEHLERIVENNAEIYRVLREGFCDAGRYHRTLGNHDDVLGAGWLGDGVLAEQLQAHLPGTVVADTILLERDGTDATDGIEGVAAVVAHGHLTDSWNGPGFALLGRAVTWMATSLDDLPRGALSSRVDGLPEETSLSRLLDGGGRNRLITVDPRYGGNRRLDSLDEERIFRRLAETEPEGGWPWMVHGHTHYPMLRPENADGVAVRYANSGCGVLRGAFTALEWDGSDLSDPLRLVLWRTGDDGSPERIELVPDGPRLRPV
jgi:hypothetical protein